MDGVTDRPERMEIAGFPCTLVRVNTLVAGAGAAGLNAALQLHYRGMTDLLVVADRLQGGTSYDAGSDKQTYYKLALSGGRLDAPRKMAEDLFRGGCMHGETALCEAAHSAEAFFHLVRLGVPFPRDRWGGWPGYRTDHDPLGRGTSAGPLTSRFMCARLADVVRRRGIPLREGLRLAALLAEHAGEGPPRVRGALFLEARPREAGRGPAFLLAAARNVILATGGPAGLFADSVYPDPSTGALGAALAAGAAARNLTEFQFGIALTRPFRWNLSGSFQQVLPRYVSRAPAGGEEREFLSEVFPDLETLLSAVFRKGYEWPFDAEKVKGYGSSLVDLLVYRETVERGRRVFLDFTRNPAGPGPEGTFSLQRLDPEARAYLARSGALLEESPLARLRALNPAAVELFRSRGLDLSAEAAEAAVCAQHLNGGLSVDAWWRSNVRGLFPVGEAAGTHGVRRPGGAALNAGQVGGIRAALYIAARAAGPPPERDAFLRAARPQVEAVLSLAREMVERGGEGSRSPEDALREIGRRMSAAAGILRDPDRAAAAAGEARALAERLPRELRARGPGELARCFLALDLGTAHAAVLEALRAYLEEGGRSRGSFLVCSREGEAPCPGLPPGWRFAWGRPGDEQERKILEVRLPRGSAPALRWEAVRPLPGEDAWFEQAWKAFREDRVIPREEEDGRDQ